MELLRLARAGRMAPAVHHLVPGVRLRHPDQDRGTGDLVHHALGRRQGAG
ncbi:hypothetical protein LP419_10625 [Massilia sp. H-1]|nr:hypothetical protein LP419_10625 [Massilia sp. H-1]